MDAPGGAAAALGVADNPACGVAGSDRPGSGQAFAGFKRDVGDLAGCGIDLIEGAFAPGIDLDCIVVTIPAWLDAGRRIGILNPAGRRGCGGTPTRRRPARRNVQRLRALIPQHGGNDRQCRHIGIVADLRRLLRRGASGQRSGGKEHGDNGGFAERRGSGCTDRRLLHSPISRDHDIALT